MTQQPNNVGAVTEERWYTQRELLETAERRGYKASQGLLEKWVGLGLLDRGTQRGRGQGRGATFLWPHAQLELFLVLLEKRPTVSRTRVLLNIPVGVWLYWGEGYIPLRQVRRAMESWADVGRKRARHDWTAMAGRIVEDIAGPNIRRQDREVAADLIAELARTRSCDPAHLLEALEPIVGPENRQMFTDAPRIADNLLAQVTALDGMREIPDPLFRWARAMCLVGQADYVREQPRLARDPRFGSMHPSPSFDDFFVRACSNLTTVLGLYLMRPEAPGLPAPLDPELWKAGRVHLRATTTYHPSPLTLPPWVEGGGIRVDVHIDADPVHPP